MSASDFGRKGLGEQVSEKVTPDSPKTTTEKASENLTGAYDKVAGAVVPDSEKSTTQKAGDSVRGNTDDAESTGKGYVAQAQDAASNLAGAASEQVKAAVDAISGTAKETKEEIK